MKFKERIKEMGYKQQDFADACKISRARVCSLSYGRSGFSSLSDVEQRKMCFLLRIEEYELKKMLRCSEDSKLGKVKVRHYEKDRLERKLKKEFGDKLPPITGSLSRSPSRIQREAGYSPDVAKQVAALDRQRNAQIIRSSGSVWARVIC